MHFCQAYRKVGTENESVSFGQPGCTWKLSPEIWFGDSASLFTPALGMSFRDNNRHLIGS